jgi:hypothetical protein
MKHLRFFISSPGDVAEERALAQKVIEQDLPKDPLLRDKVTCEAVRWDDPAAPVAMPAMLTPQEAIDRGLRKPSQCDVVIVILWSRMGTPLTISKPDGTPYLSGTEWEYEDAITASPKPHVLVYRRTAKLALDPDDKELEEKSAQWKKVGGFLGRFSNPDGSLKGGFAQYETPQQFKDRLSIDLKSFIVQCLGGMAAGAHALHPPPPYTQIAKALRARGVVPFIGSGVRATGRAADTEWHLGAPKFLPSGAELSRFLADETQFPSDEADREPLAEVASYYEAFSGRRTLHERLRQIFGSATLDQSAIPPFYRLLAEVNEPLLIVTTNYDTQLEQAFHAVQRPYDLVVYPADRKDLANAVLWWQHGAPTPTTPAPNELDIDLEHNTVIFKMHGTIQPETDTWDGVVITESDYVDFLSRVGSKSAIPSQFSAHLYERILLFVGFGLSDWSSRTILRSLKLRPTGDGDEEIPRWAVNQAFTEIEMQLWRKRGVYPFIVGLDEFVAELQKKMTP